MQPSSEIFVMVIFVIGIPIIFFTLRDSDLPEHRLFMGSYLILVFSNVVTVVEEFWFNALFNFLEHFFIAVAAFVFLIAVIRMTSRQRTVPEPGIGEAGE